MCYRICAIFLLSACACSPLVPAAKPPQLQHTPGAFVTVGETRFDAGIFQLDYPSNWRVVKLSTANTNAIKVAFVAPDQSTVTLTQVESADENVIRLDDGVALTAEIEPAGRPGNSFFNAAKHLVSSIRN